MDNNKIIFSILDYYQNINIDFDVYIIADAQTKTCKYMPERIIHANEDEFFSRTEFAEIMSAIFNCFGFAKVFYSEIEFIQYTLAHNIDKSECIVYNFSRDGRVNGKKSLIPAFCDLMDIRYTGSDAFVISLLRNKYIYTKFLEQNGISVPKSLLYRSTSDFSLLLSEFKNQYVIVKNKCESASIGMTHENIFELKNDSVQYLDKLLTIMHTNSVLVQEYIDGIECEIFVLQYKGNYYALDPVQILFKNEMNIIDTDTSNSYNYDFRVINSPVKSLIQETAKKIAELLEIKDYARFDFRIKNGIPYLFDIAGTPYTIYHSSIAYLFTQYYHIAYEAIYKIIVACMLSNYDFKIKHKMCIVNQITSDLEKRT